MIFPFLLKVFDKLFPEDKFNEISSKTASYNKLLKDIAGLAEIDKPISSHTARHTFADLARQGNANLYNLSKTLGHSSLDITERY